MHGTSGHTVVELRLLPIEEGIDANDRNWGAELAQLSVDLQRDAGDVRRDVTSVEGAKGAELIGLIVALGSSGAFTAAVQLLKVWLGRERERSLTIELIADGRCEERLEVRSGELSDAAFERLGAAAIRTLSKRRG